MKSKIVDIGNLVEIKCKKVLGSQFDNKIAKIESDLQSVLMQKENCSTNKNSKEGSTKNKNNLVGSYSMKNETSHLKKYVDDTIKVVDKVKQDN